MWADQTFFHLYQLIKLFLGIKGLNKEEITAECTRIFTKKGKLGIK